MASIYILKEGGGILADVDYSLVDRRVRSFEYDGQILYSEYEKIDIEGWKDKLWQLVLDQGLNIDGGRGLHAFVYPLIAEYDSR